MILRFRFRTQALTGKLVLQVLDRYPPTVNPAQNSLSPWLHIEEWRDARTEDMGEVHALIGKPSTQGNA